MIGSEFREFRRHPNGKVLPPREQIANAPLPDVEERNKQVAHRRYGRPSGILGSQFGRNIGTWTCKREFKQSLNPFFRHGAKRPHR